MQYTRLTAANQNFEKLELIGYSRLPQVSSSVALADAGAAEAAAAGSRLEVAISARASRAESWIRVARE